MRSDAAPAERLLRGVVEDVDGRPLAGAVLRADGSSDEVVSASDGQFALRVANGADTVALALTVRGRRIVVRVAADATDRVRVTAVPADAVPIRVLTPGSAPVPSHFGWQALRRVEGGLDAGPTGEATEPRFAAASLPPGTYALVVWGGPFLPMVCEPVVLDGTSSHALVTVELARRGASVAGRVLSATHAPLPGVRVRLRPDDAALSLPDARTTSVSDAGGRYRVEGLPAGRYAVLCDTGQRKPVESVANLVDREERAMDLVI